MNIDKTIVPSLSQRPFTGLRRHLWVLLVLLAIPTVTQAQFTYITNGNNTITITGYTGSGGALVIPDTINGLPVASIGDNAFGFRSGLTSVAIPDSVTSISVGAFSNCTNLMSVSIGNSVTTIFDGAFAGCTRLTDLTIPNSVTSIGYDVFVGCFGLTNITVAASNPNFSSLNGVLFDKRQTTLVEYPGGLVGSYTIPDGVTSIGNYAFAACTNLTSVTIPNSVTSIEYQAFFNCNGLTSVTIGNGVTYIGGEAFAYCAGLTSVIIPNSVTDIENQAFYPCTNLTAAYFQGSAPWDLGDAFFGDGAGMTVYYLLGTTGWGSTFGGVPAVLWNPQATAFNLAGGQFGFNITGPTNATIVVEACTSLTNPIWLPVSTNTLTGGASSFSDPQSVNYPSRFYRFRSN